MCATVRRVVPMMSAKAVMSTAGVLVEMSATGVVTVLHQLQKW